MLVDEKRQRARSQPAADEQAAFSAWGAFLAAHAAVTARLDAALQERVGISLGWYDVLVHVAAAPERRLRLRDLDQQVLISQPTVSRLAARMAAVGLLSRSTPEDDHRGVQIALTGMGARRLRQARAVAIEVIRDTFAAALTDEAAVRLHAQMIEIHRRACG